MNYSTAWKVRRISRKASKYTSEADLSEADLSESLWLDRASRFTRVLPIPYVQNAILNLLNPYIWSCYCTPWYIIVGNCIIVLVIHVHVVKEELIFSKLFDIIIMLCKVLILHTKVHTCKYDVTKTSTFKSKVSFMWRMINTCCSVVFKCTECVGPPSTAVTFNPNDHTFWWSPNLHIHVHVHTCNANHVAFIYMELELSRSGFICWVNYCHHLSCDTGTQMLFTLRFTPLLYIIIYIYLTLFSTSILLLSFASHSFPLLYWVEIETLSNDFMLTVLIST